MANETPQQSEDVIIEGHTYDGIQEYDNPMPKWWVLMFWATIVWSVFYVIAISVGWINSYDGNLEKQNDRVDGLRAAAADANPAITPEYLKDVTHDDALIAVGQTTFTAVCAACHGDKGQGLIGPNLTDDAWLHGGSLMEIYDVVTDGVPHKGMPAWGNSLKHDQRVGVVAYIDSIRDTNVAGGKAPEGDIYAPAQDDAPDADDDDTTDATDGDEPNIPDANTDAPAVPDHDDTHAAPDDDTEPIPEENDSDPE